MERLAAGSLELAAMIAWGRLAHYSVACIFQPEAL
jgi:hypothetical protein